MVDIHGDRNPVEVLADEFAARFRSGERPSVAEYTQRYPDLADEITELFPSIVMMEQLKQKQVSDLEAVQRQSRFRGKRLDRLGDYEIVREIGRGGMGVVFEAVQASLGRRVAVKVLSANATASEKQVKRFAREARAAAALHHTNIVPVFGVGHEEDLHFYVMQFIDGVGLDEILLALRYLVAEPAEASESESAVLLAEALRCGSFAGPRRLGSSSHLSGARETRDVPAGDETISSDRQAASPGDASFVLEEPASGQVAAATVDARAESSPPPFGLQYFKSVARIGLQVADALQYAHGQNVLHRDIKPGNLLLDAQGTVWVTDFGLAKVTEQHDLTKTGDIVGTLRYMAPEQFDGVSDARSDLYSLGLTLYELLTLKPACDDTAIKQLLDQRSSDRTVRPRAINRDIPRDLETIVMKAIAADPAHRYPAATDLAEDLQRFLDDRPILARRVTPIERFWRWSQRNPALAALSGTAAVLAALVVVVLMVAYLRVDRERVRAEANLELAVSAFDDIIKNIGSRGVPQPFELELDGEEDVPQYEITVTAADAELLTGLLSFFDRFARQNAADLDVQTARAYRRVGDIRQRLNQYGAATEAYQKALGLYDGLSRQKPSEHQYVIDRSQVLAALANMKRQTRQFLESWELFEQARDLLAAQPEPLASHPDLRFALAEANLAMAPHRSLRGSGSRQRGGRRPAGAESRSARSPPSPRAGAGRRRVGPRRVNPERASEWREQEEKWNAALRDAKRLLDGLLVDEPEKPAYRLALARYYLAEMRLARERPVSASSWQQSLALLKQLAADFPGDPRYRYELADTLSMIGFHEEDHERVTDELERARSIAEGLANQFPGVPEYELLLGSCLMREARESDAAVKLLTQAAAQFRKLVDRRPSVSLYKWRLAIAWRELVETLGEAGRSERAAAELAEAVEYFTAVDSEYLRYFIGRYYVDLQRSGRHVDAERLRESYPQEYFRPSGPNFRTPQGQ